LQLIPALGDLGPFEIQLDRILKAIVQLRQTKADWQDAGVWNDAHLVSTVLRCANDISHTPVGERLRASLPSDLVEVWSWNREVMGQLAEVAETQTVEL
jgi:hypothetical protein